MTAFVYTIEFSRQKTIKKQLAGYLAINKAELKSQLCELFKKSSPACIKNYRLVKQHNIREQIAQISRYSADVSGLYTSPPGSLCNGIRWTGVGCCTRTLIDFTEGCTIYRKELPNLIDKL